MIERKEKDIGMRIHAINHTLKRKANRLIAEKYTSDISGFHVYMLGYIGNATKDGNEITQKDLETHFGLTRSGISRALDVLESNGLIQRIVDSNDTRKKKIVLTDKAKAFQEDMTRDAERTEEILLKGFTKQEKENLIDYLDRIIENMEDFGC